MCDLWFLSFHLFHSFFCFSSGCLCVNRSMFICKWLNRESLLPFSKWTNSDHWIQNHSQMKLSQSNSATGEKWKYVLRQWDLCWESFKDRNKQHLKLTKVKVLKHVLSSIFFFFLHVAYLCSHRDWESLQARPLFPPRWAHQRELWVALCVFVYEGVCFGCEVLGREESWGAREVGVICGCVPFEVVKPSV